jgi:hypothetical protein
MKNAIYDARAENKLINFITLEAPLSAERIRLACGDELIDFDKS